jgi:protocatechuate 3,4-dioxygenase beta subunit
MKIQPRRLSRREMVGLMGAAGAAMIVGCGDDDDDEPRAPASGTPAPEGTATAAETEAATETATAAVTPDQVACIVTPDQTEGPYFVDEMLNRSDITVDPTDGSVKPGLPLRLGFVVYRVDGEACEPIEGAMVDVWHCDHLGVYSDVVDATIGFDTTGQMFLRGFQVTDASGAVESRQSIQAGTRDGQSPSTSRYAPRPRTAQLMSSPRRSISRTT